MYQHKEAAVHTTFRFLVIGTAMFVRLIYIRTASSTSKLNCSNAENIPNIFINEKETERARSPFTSLWQQQ
jgi:hypothetical protein